MDTFVNFYSDERTAAAEARAFKNDGFRVALAGPSGQTYCKNGGDYPNEPVPGERWIVVATMSELIEL